jgi:hypothetical protein
MRGAQKAQPFVHPLDERVRRRRAPVIADGGPAKARLFPVARNRCFPLRVGKGGVPRIRAAATDSPLWTHQR